jgi:hypothetical protein
MADSTSLANSGALTLAAGTTFYLDKVTLDSGTTASGGGTLHMNGTTTLNGTLTTAAPVTLTSTLTGSGTLRMNAPMTWTGGSLSLSGGVEILSGNTLALSGAVNLYTGTSVKNFGTVNWSTPASFTYNGGSITVRNEAGGLWNLTAGAFAVVESGAPSPGGSFLFQNAGTMQGAGNPDSQLNVVSVGFSNTGTISNMQVNVTP